MTEKQLLDRYVAAEDPNAFTVLIERHGPMVLSVCRSVLREPHDVEDAFQTTFLVLARRAATIKHSTTIGPWLHRVAIRVAQRARFKAAQRRNREQIRSDFEPVCPYNPPDFSLAPLLREEVSRLPDRYRLPVELCYWQGKSNQEAATQLRCPVGTIKGRLSRARQTLRDRLIRRGVGSDAGYFDAISPD